VPVEEWRCEGEGEEEEEEEGATISSNIGVDSVGVT
jgi:hypothetical protein